jgi:hypothetical protein
VGGISLEIGVSTFVETMPDVKTGEVISHAQRTEYDGRVKL